MEYKAVLENYLEEAAREEFFDDALYGYAMEASAETNAVNTGNPNVANSQGTDGTGFRTNPNQTLSGAGNVRQGKIMETIKKILNAIKAMIDKASMRLKNRAKKMLLSDQGFKNKLRERERSVQPLKAVKITSYRYVDQYLDNVVAKLRTSANKMLEELMNCSDPRNIRPLEDEILKSPADEIVGKVLQDVSRSNEVQDVPSFFRHIQNQYRGKKQETIYKQTDLQNLIRLAEDSRAINLQLNKYSIEAQKFVATMQNRSNQLTAPGISEEQKRDFLRNLTKAQKILNMYESVLSYVYELKVEKSLNYRLIVQKFYQF